MTTEVETIQQEVTAFVGTLPTTIENATQATEAMEALVPITKKRKEVEKFFKEKFIDPAHALWKGAKKEAEDAMAPLVASEAKLRQGLTAWNAAERARIAKEQEKLNKQHEKRVANAEAKGKDIEMVKPPVVVQAPQKTAQVTEGAVTFKEVKTLVIFDEALIPDAYMIKTPNRVMIKAALNANTRVPGCRMDKEESLAVRPT